MQYIRKNLCAVTAVVAASLLLALAVGAASANSISSSNQNIRATWRSLEFATSVTVRCPVTLEGSFHSRTIAKIERTLIGAITKAIVKNESCTNGSASGSNLPWHITYEGFAGTLPNINTVNILISRFRLQITVPGFCSNGEYGIETDNITGAASREVGGAITSLTPIEGRNAVNIVMLRELCPASARFRGSGSVTVLGSASRITLTLI